MGGSSSKSHGNASPKNARKAVGAHSVLPEDVTPYQGPKIQFLSISVPVQMQAHFVSGATAGAHAVTSNVNAYYPMINQYLGQGYNLTTFYRVPGSSQTSGFGSAVVNFEAIFHKPENHHSDTAPGQLLIDKATMHLQHSHGGLLTMNVAQGTVADTSDIMNKIVHHSTQGGRLICLEINGDVTTQGMSAAMSGISSGIGVDVFFEIPPQPSPARYVYQVINVPIGIHVQMGFNPKPTVVCDWLGTLSTHLNQGWKLVEIFLDQSQQRASGFSTSGSMNSAWFFEKEAHRLHDPTPLYQGTVIEYYHKISMGFTGVKTKTDWFPVLEEMGQKGWELTCIQETPEVIREGMMKLQMKLMIFFQRPIPQQPFPQQPIPQQPFPQQPIPQQPFPQQPIPQQPFPQQPIPQQPFPQQSFPQQPLPPGSQPPPQEAPPPYPK